jgi:uncharacterized protein (TIGR02757 family)
MKSLTLLKRRLDYFYRTYNFKKRLKHDPISFPRRYRRPEDIEVAGFLASCFAYGKVELFTPVIERILKPAGKHPARFFLNFSLKRDAKYFRGLQYRFHNEDDILCLLYRVNQVLKSHGSIKNLFLKHYSNKQEDIGHALDYLCKSFRDLSCTTGIKRDKKSVTLSFFPSPHKGSACKRLNLFLRWMVRDKDIDLGVWNEVSPSKLIIPLDTHIARISICLGLTRRTSSDWKTSKEITESLKQLDPDDPLKYDFALCHQGISGMCRGVKFKDICNQCTINIL